MSRNLGWIVLTFLLGAASVYGQATAQIQGIVADPTGSALPGADVKATQTDTGIERSVATGADGTYVLPNLPIGPYRLEVSKSGFATAAQTGIEIGRAHV